MSDDIWYGNNNTVEDSGQYEKRTWETAFVIIAAVIIIVSFASWIFM